MPFIPDLSVILAFAVATFVIAITPGPDMALQMSRSINYGFRHGIACGLGAIGIERETIGGGDGDAGAHEVLLLFVLSVRVRLSEDGSRVLRLALRAAQDEGRAKSSIG